MPVTSTQVPTAPAALPNRALSEHVPTGTCPSDAGLLDLRAFVILGCSLWVALLTGAGAALLAACTIEQAPVIAATIAGLATAFTSLIGTAATINSLISRPTL